ncbi:hypothetical protein L3081_24895 [Colwellia sp. MSW7]|uniref:Uncharacterized protein n=1 Tax=Colwellia maritima TaxID=2912588 RepID=A0ABS9X756_9GAMM|nr:hypothetical protein [Colwellia maritima]MCI2286063.1 hypothetical protein [Colwellia maritima]
MFLFFLVIAVAFLFICTGNSKSQEHSTDFIAEAFEADKEDDLNRSFSFFDYPDDLFDNNTL